MPLWLSAGRAVETQCSKCHFKVVCPAGRLATANAVRGDTLSFPRRRLRKGQPLFREGEHFQVLFAVRSGTFKSIVSSTGGREQVIGFDMGGELMGLDALAEGKHASASVALEDAEVCSIPYEQLVALSAGSADRLLGVSRLMSQEIVRKLGLTILMGSVGAEGRVASFLLNFSQRMHARGYSRTEFHMSMSRGEIGSYLGMTLETVSRAFSGLHQQRMLQVDRKHVHLLDLDGLSRAFDGTEPELASTPRVVDQHVARRDRQLFPSAHSTHNHQTVTRPDKAKGLLSGSRQGSLAA